MILTIQLVEVKYHSSDRQFCERELFDIFSNMKYCLFEVRNQYLRGSHPDIDFVEICGGQQT